MVTPRKRGHRSHWSDDDIEYLRQWYGNMPINRLSKILTRRCSGIHQMAWKLGLQKRKYLTNTISQERYEAHMALNAIFNGIAPRHMFRDLRHHETALSAIKFAAWAALRDEGVSYKALARASGLNHTSIMYGVERHAEIMARRSAEAAE